MQTIFKIFFFSLTAALWLTMSISPSHAAGELYRATAGEPDTLDPHKTIGAMGLESGDWNKNIIGVVAVVLGHTEIEKKAQAK